MSDVMLYGVLRMPYEMAMADELSRYQFYQRAQEAADRLEAAERIHAAPVPASTGRGIAEDMCSTMMGVAELKRKMANSKEQVEAALEISGARDLDVEAERREFEEVLGADFPHLEGSYHTAGKDWYYFDDEAESAWQGWKARAARGAAAPAEQQQQPEAKGSTLFCTYPKCNCPFDAPADPNWCARGLAKGPAA